MTAEMQATRISGLEGEPMFRARAAKLMAATIAKLAVRPVRSEAVFVDDNGPKGGRAMRCALTVHLPYRPSVRVERSAETARLAFDAAFAVLERQLERYREGDRDNKRHPKKYFAAARAAGEERLRSPRRARS
jgi:ribosome-associated translation inhibitor RaiA